MSRFVSEKQGFRGQQPFNYRADAGEFSTPLNIIITRYMARSFPSVTKFVQPASERLTRNRDTAARVEFQRQRATTPSRATPAEVLRCALDDGDERPLERRQPTRRLAFCARVYQPPLTAFISCHHTVHTRARAKEKPGNLGRRASLRAQHQDMERKQVAIARGAKFREHRALFVNGNIEYGFSRHRLVHLFYISLVVLTDVSERTRLCQSHVV